MWGEREGWRERERERGGKGKGDRKEKRESTTYLSR
jgi:hypothetical protein